jgi:hypothetical protein
MLRFPDEPEHTDGRRASGRIHLRYEDVSQDGRIMLDALPQAYGHVVWSSLLTDHPISLATRERGIVPILSRIVLEGGGGPVSVRRSLAADGCYELAHTVDDAGAPSRLLLRLWATVRGEKGKTHGPPPADAGASVDVGRVFAEHVFTRLFHRPEERKVTRFEVPGLPPVPPDVRPWFPAEGLLELPEGASWLDTEESVDAGAIAFSIGQTDSNRHVNSLVYPRLFEEAALRRLALLGKSTNVLSRFVETRFRKPCFAGDRVRFVLRAFTLDGRTGAVGRLVPEAAVAAPDTLAIARPHCTLLVAFDA